MGTVLVAKQIVAEALCERILERKSWHEAKSARMPHISLYIYLFPPRKFG
jgi:hypothetical protein